MIGRALALAGIFGCAGVIKAWGAKADPDAMRILLEPTAWLAGAVLGEVPQWEEGVGAVLAGHGLLVTAGCAGVNFWTVAFASLALGHLEAWPSAIQRAGWILASLAVGFGSTIVANALRVSATAWRRAQGLGIAPESAGEWHRAEGLAVYLLALLVVLALSERFVPERALV